MTKEISKAQNKPKKSAIKTTIGCIFAICSVITLFTFIGEILSPRKVADGKIVFLSEANYKLVDKASSKTVDDPCIVKYSYSVDGKDINSEQQFQSKTACVDFPLEEGQRI